MSHQKMHSAKIRLLHSRHSLNVILMPLKKLNVDKYFFLFQNKDINYVVEDNIQRHRYYDKHQQAEGLT